MHSFDGRLLGQLNLTTVNVQGVAAALGKHESGESKGVKAHFRMDESGILHLDKVSSACGVGVGI